MGKVTVDLTPIEGPVKVLARATFATGSSFLIRRDTRKSKTACEVYDEQNKTTHPATTVAKAWANIRYMARVEQATENTTGWKVHG